MQNNNRVLEGKANQAQLGTNLCWLRKLFQHVRQQMDTNASSNIKTNKYYKPTHLFPINSFSSWMNPQLLLLCLGRMGQTNYYDWEGSK